jgi:hypothetical protein
VRPPPTQSSIYGSCLKIKCQASSWNPLCLNVVEVVKKSPPPLPERFSWLGDRMAAFSDLSFYFMDDRHAMQPVVVRRKCVDIFINMTALLMSLATGAFGAYATVFDFGTQATPYHAVIAGLGFGLFVWSRMGEWVLGDPSAPNGRPVESYSFMVLQWWLCVALMWAGIADYAQMRRAQEFIEENWYILQAQIVIPFTTQLDSKINLEANTRTLLGLSIVTSILSMALMTEAWAALGGQLALVQRRYATLLPEIVPILALASATIAYATYGAEVSAYSTEFGTEGLLWLAAMAALTIVSTACVVAANIAWGVTFIAHASAAIAYAVPSFILFVTSIVIIQRARTIDAFVLANWETLRLFVPPQYAALPWDKYAEAAETPQKQAGTAGLILSVILLFSVIFHINAASVILSVGPQLKRQQETFLRRREALLAVARGQITAEAAADAEAAALENEGSLGDGNNDKVPEIASYSPGKSGRRIYKSTSLRNLGWNASSAEAGPLLGARSEMLADPIAPPLPGEIELSRSMSARSASSRKIVAGVAGVPKIPVIRRDGGSDDALPGSVQLARMQVRDRLAAVSELSELEASNNLAMTELEKKVVVPKVYAFVKTLEHDAITVWGRNSQCVIFAMILTALAVGGLAGGLAKIASDTTCATLASNKTLVTATYNVTLPFAGEYGDPLFAGILTIAHSFPKGSVEFVNDFVDFPAGQSEGVVFEMTYFATTPSELPSRAEAEASLVGTDFYTSSDDWFSGYAKVNATFSPPKSYSSCSGVRVRVRTNVYPMNLNVRSDSAAVFIRGNAPQAGLSVPASSLTAVMVATSAAPVSLINVWADGISRFHPEFSENASFYWLHPDPAIKITTGQGDAYLLDCIPTGVRISTNGGNIFSTGTANGALGLERACGDLELSAGGYGRVVVSQAFVAYQAWLSTVHGQIIVANSGTLIATDLTMRSVDGDILVTSMLQVRSMLAFRVSGILL